MACSVRAILQASLGGSDLGEDAGDAFMVELGHGIDWWAELVELELACCFGFVKYPANGDEVAFGRRLRGRSSHTWS